MNNQLAKDSNSSPETGKPKNSLWKTFIKIILVIIVFYFLYKQLAVNWQAVIDYDWKIKPGLLILSILMHLFTFVLLSRVWCILIKALGHEVKLIHGFKIAYIADLGRYIPGKIWPVFGMVYLAKQLGIREEKAITSWALAMIFALPSAFFAAAVCLLISPEILTERLTGYLGPGVYIALAVIFIISLSLVFIPNKTLALFNVLLRLIRRSPIAFNLKKSTALLVYIGYTVCWLSYGFAFWLFLNAATSNENLPLLPSMASFIIAYQIGYLAFFAPGGVGIRELILTLILAPYLGPITAGVAVAARIWNMATEITAAVIAWFIKFPKKSD